MRDDEIMTVYQEDEDSAREEEMDRVPPLLVVVLVALVKASIHLCMECVHRRGHIPHMLTDTTPPPFSLCRKLNIKVYYLQILRCGHNLEVELLLLRLPSTDLIVIEEVENSISSSIAHVGIEEELTVLFVRGSQSIMTTF